MMFILLRDLDYRELLTEFFFKEFAKGDNLETFLSQPLNDAGAKRGL